MTDQQKTDRVWLITGASSGFGMALAEAALANGDKVAATARRTEKLEDLLQQAPERAYAVALDVTDPQSVSRAVDEVIERFGRVDVLVNNAGHGQVGAVEETTEKELREIFDVHVFGPAALVRAVLPAMREQSSGAIVQMSSFGGQVSYPGFSAYCATKFRPRRLFRGARRRGLSLWYQDPYRRARSIPHRIFRRRSRAISGDARVQRNSRANKRDDHGYRRHPTQ